MKHSYCICFWVTMVILVSCQTKGKKEVASNEGNDSSGIAELQHSDSAMPLYTQFYLEKNATERDSFQHNTSWIKFISIDKKKEFPFGFMSLQQALNDSIHHLCEVDCKLCEEFLIAGDDDTAYCALEGEFIESFNNTQGKSFFASHKELNYYFFLTQVDSSNLLFEDTEYGFLHFMKLKTHKSKLEYKNKVVQEEYVNICDQQEITWKVPVNVNILDKNKWYRSTFTQWKEVWECGQKVDYAPEYAWIKLEPVKGIFKRYSDYSSPLNGINDPYFVFSYVALDESTDELKQIQTNVVKMQLVTTKGKVRKGLGIDLNGDKHADVFWYDRIYLKGAPTLKRNTVLYLKLATGWTPVYIHNFSRFY